MNTLRSTVTSWVIVGATPVTKTGYHPAAAAAVFEMVIVEAPGRGLTGLGLKPTVVPAGWPEEFRVTGSL